jgi:hypothetical protein
LIKVDTVLQTFDPPVDRTRKLLEVKRELKAVSTAISNAKTKAKMLTEHPEEAKSFICMTTVVLNQHLALAVERPESGVDEGDG